ncbi:hypothetical protein A3742_08580 [Oleiphilus sp. HI0071]|nr:hypothetical protein A3737_21670 [Oleiphilus sp. HI0065]KZY82723.1 hypothetical protein A3742_08580 [Oleiphilus sp. HI0071]KZY92946.1 hypothetical protein A3744_18635 [Oleiphilus sp. HI0073]KZZ13800.1 hypothetical protein A3751_04600 [Oleiphilus sp. HI0080]KZZ13997.1 hypothetical protein A3750_16020 [Oleiphilus sp. HI0079]KZZ51196.1 hypothetical protein A3760_01265 [Oleiphilus sp. HI0122]KZZ64918.1 hypothetical protein A3765_06365 [Oleiphilus sp. HI0130]KZZ81385.1 hypothetical protein A37
MAQNEGMRAMSYKPRSAAASLVPLNGMFGLPIFGFEVIATFFLEDTAINDDLCVLGHGFARG